MPTTLEVIGLVILLTVGFIITNRVKQYRIRHSGTRVMARVTQVHSWNNSIVQGNSILPKGVPLLTAGWQHEVIGECIDPVTQQTHIISSGKKNGLPKYQRGDILSAYLSPKGDYLDLP